MEPVGGAFFSAVQGPVRNASWAFCIGPAGSIGRFAKNNRVGCPRNDDREATHTRDTPRSPTARGSRSLLSALAPVPFGAETVARDHDLMRMMREPVERRRREQRTLKQIGPFGERSIRGDNERPTLVALIDHLVEIFGTGRWERFEPEVVEHEHVGPGVGEQTSLVGAIGPSPVQVAQQAGGRDEDDVEAAATGLMPERLGQVRFADTGRALNQHGLVAFHKLTRGQVEDLLPIDGRIETEIEPLQGLAEVDGRPPQAQLQLLLGPPLDFVFDQALEEIDIGEFLGDRLVRADLERRQDA